MLRVGAIRSHLFGWFLNWKSSSGVRVVGGDGNVSDEVTLMDMGCQIDARQRKSKASLSRAAIRGAEWNGCLIVR